MTGARPAAVVRLARPPAPAARRPRFAFTLIELLVVIAIMGLLASMALVVFARTGESARVAGTKALITVLDSAVAERVEALRRFNFKPLARTAQDDVDDHNKIYTYKLLYRGAFPQRLQDLGGPQGNLLDRASNLPLFFVVEKKLNVTIDDMMKVAQYSQSVSSAELLFLALTEGTSFGLAPLDLDLISSQYIADTDGDGLQEFVDGWGNPLRFYNAPTGLLRPQGNVYDPPPGQPITQADYNNARLLIRTLPPFIATDPMMAPGQINWNDYTSPLNIDPDDPIGEFDTFFLKKNMDPKEENFMEAQFHAVNTYYTPLIISAGPDGRLGLYEPNDTSGANNHNRLGVISQIEDVYDNLTNRQRGG